VIPPDLGGLGHVDAIRGLALSGGSETLYRKLLARFVTGFADFPSRYRAARTTAEPGAAERAAHTLKSSAAQIGAQPLAEAASILEMAERKGEADAESRILPDVAARLAEVLSDLGPLTSGLATMDPAGSDAPTPAKGDFLDAATRMADLLERGEFGAVSLFEEIGPILRQGFDVPTWIAFSRAIQSFHLPEALGLLRGVMTTAKEP
jgi:two-component system sensor histidine kinase/response regulator